jgi:polyhydroxyalkanoate synthesis regulator phasin
LAKTGSAHHPSVSGHSPLGSSSFEDEDDPPPQAQQAPSLGTSGNHKQPDSLEKLVEESLLYSEAQLSHAQESVERLRRALVNVYLDAGSTATEDMQDLRTSIEELEITLETLKGEQHRVMAALVSQAPSSSHVAATSH